MAGRPSGRRQIDLAPVAREPGGRSPVSCVLLSRATGSRTIVHHRELREYRAADLARHWPLAVDWVHFEGREPGELGNMLEMVRGAGPHPVVSLEVEKPRPGLEELWSLADVLILARAWAGAVGLESPGEVLARARRAAPEAVLVCPWGAEGAWLELPGEAAVCCGAPAPGAVIESLGAGDVFNAGLIDARLRGLPWRAALEAGVGLAARKVGRAGLVP